MKVTGKTLAAIITVLLLAGFGVYAFDRLREGTEVRGGGERIALAQLPPAVKATMERESQGGSTVKETKKITEGDKALYEVDIVTNGMEQEMIIAEDGRVIERGMKDDDDD